VPFLEKSFFSFLVELSNGASGGFTGQQAASG
jgi:hypothetical protein